MNLPSCDPAAEAFERLREEVALLRRAVEGLAAEPDKAIDYSPTLASLSEALEALANDLRALGERPFLQLSPQLLGQVLQRISALALEKPLVELERDRAALGRALESLANAQQADQRRRRDRRRRFWAVGASALVGAATFATLVEPALRATVSAPHLEARSCLLEPATAASGSDFVQPRSADVVVRSHSRR